MIFARFFSELKWFPAKIDVLSISPGPSDLDYANSQLAGEIFKSTKVLIKKVTDLSVAPKERMPSGCKGVHMQRHSSESSVLDRFLELALLETLNIETLRFHVE